MQHLPSAKVIGSTASASFARSGASMFALFKMATYSTSIAQFGERDGLGGLGDNKLCQIFKARLAVEIETPYRVYPIRIFDSSSFIQRMC